MLSAAAEAFRVEIQLILAPGGSRASLFASAPVSDSSPPLERLFPSASDSGLPPGLGPPSGHCCGGAGVKRPLSNPGGRFGGPRGGAGIPCAPPLLLEVRPGRDNKVSECSLATEARSYSQHGSTIWPEWG